MYYLNFGANIKDLFYINKVIIQKNDNNRELTHLIETPPKAHLVLRE